MPVIQFSPHELKGKRIFLLLEIDFGTFGHFRMSTEPLFVPGTGGGRFDGGLDSFTFADSVDLFSTSETSRSVSISAFLPIDVSELVARGLDPSRATASLSQWVEGSNYEDRRRVMPATELRDPQYGESYEPLKFSIRSNLYDDGAMIPPAAAVIDGTTFPFSPDWQRGRAYPWIFGTPGKHVASVLGGFDYDYVSPAYQVTTAGTAIQSFVVAGHEMTPGTTCSIAIKDAISTINTGTVYTHRDGAGRLISLVDNTAFLSADIGEGVDMIAQFTTGGGVLNEQQTAPRRGMGEIIEYLLDYAPRILMDRGRTRTAGELLNHMKIDGVITEPVEVWRWLRANLLPFAPVSLAHGPDGMFPIVWDKDITENDTLAQVDAERDQWERTSPVTVEHLDGGPRNSFSIAYAVMAHTGAPEKRVTLDGSLEASNSYARTSYKRYGSREKPEEEAIAFYQQEDVEAVLAWWSRIYGFPMRSVEYTAPIEWGWLEAGSHIRFTDSRLHIIDQIAIVQSVEFSDQQIVGLRLVWLEDMPRDDRLI